MFCTISTLLPKILFFTGALLMITQCGSKRGGFHTMSDKKIDKVMNRISSKLIKKLELTDNQTLKLDAIIVKVKSDIKEHQIKKQKRIEMVSADLADTTKEFSEITATIKGDFSKMPIDTIFDYVEDFYNILDKDQKIKFRTIMSKKLHKHKK